jgi:predicted metal-binding protein
MEEKRRNQRCDFCGVPFPDTKTPYKPITARDQEGNNMVFCCLGCSKGHEKVTKIPSQNPIASLSKTKITQPTIGKKIPPISLAAPALKPYHFLAQKAIEFGANHAALILAKNVVVDPRAKYKCFIPICRKLGSNLCCPPFSLPVEETLRLRDSYQHALLIQCLGKPEEFTYEATQQGIQMKYYLRVNNIVSAIESLAQKKGYYLAIGFGAGHCKLCGHGVDPNIKCAGVVGGKPLWNRCRYPLRARPAMESVGIDVFKTVRKAGLRADFHGITSTVEEVQGAATFGVVFID